MSEKLNILVGTAWLERHLDDPCIRILDCTVFLTPHDGGVSRESGFTAWQKSHIPGSDFADLLTEWSDQDSALPLMKPSAERIAQIMSRYGMGEGTHVVLYDRCMQLSAAWLWWMLRTFGFDDVSVLNGGWEKWKQEKRPVSKDTVACSGGSFVPRMRHDMIADKTEVLKAIGNSEYLIIDALSADQHRGRVARYGRPGHIPSSINLYARDLVDPDTHAYLPVKELKRKCDAAGDFLEKRVITYCGAGPAGSNVAFVLTLLGASNVAVYDGALSEWAMDESLPMEIAESGRS